MKVIDRATRRVIFAGSPLEALRYLPQSMTVREAARRFLFVLAACFSLAGCLDPIGGSRAPAQLCDALATCSPHLRRVISTADEPLDLEDPATCAAQLEAGWVWGRPGADDRLVSARVSTECAATLNSMTCPTELARMPGEVRRALEACSEAL